MRERPHPASCADMLKWAMLELVPWCRLYDAKIIGQVHDEVIFLVPEEVADDFMEIVRSIMVSIKDKYNLIVPIEAEPNKGPNWREAK